MKNFARCLVSEEYGFQMEPCDENVEKAHELLDKMNFYFVEWRNPQVCMPSDTGGVLLTT